MSGKCEAADLAVLYMDVVPKAIREFRREMRGARSLTMTVPQFRILALLDDACATTTELAEQLGLSVPAMSRMVDWLSERELVERRQDNGDRRKVRVKLTHKGSLHFARFRKEARARLQKRFDSMDPATLKDLNQGLAALSEVVNHMGKTI